MNIYFLSFWGQSFTVNIFLQMNQLLCFYSHLLFEAHLNMFFSAKNSWCSCVMNSWNKSKISVFDVIYRGH